MNEAFRRQAVQLRKRGLSYSEILRRIPVAKSTLSSWLHHVGLSRHQTQRLTAKKLAAARRGGARRRSMRLEAIEKIYAETARDITTISTRELFLIGVALHWAEGSKEKEGHPGSGVKFSNSDPRMIKLFMRWLSVVCAIPKEDIIPEVYIHKSATNSVPGAIRFWSLATGINRDGFKRIYFKQNKLSTNRKRVGADYFGLLRIVVRRSSILNRKIAGWINAINKCMM